MTSPAPRQETFVSPPSGAFAVGCSAVLLGIPTIASVAVLWSNFGLAVAAIPLGVWLLAAAGAYALFNVEHQVSLDERGLRYSHARLIFGVRRSEHVEWEIPLARLTKVREVKTRSPARNGGWNHQTVLQLPEGHKLRATQLGGDDSSDTAYARLVAALKRRLGDGFEQQVDH